MRRIIVEYEKCDGCKNCSAACMQAHRKTPGTIYDLDLTDPENESRNYILKGDDGTYRPLFCRHCDEPECVMSCMSGALQKDPETGIVTYDETKCGSCFMCVMNCPFGVLEPDRMTKKKRLLLLKNLPLMISFGSLKKIHLLIWLPVRNFGKFLILFSFKILPE